MDDDQAARPARQGAGDWFPKRRIGDLPRDAAARWPQEPALYDSGRWWTHREVDAEVDRVAKGLLAMGVQPQEKVGLWIVNRAEFVFAYFAAAKLGAVVVPLNTRYRARDFGQALHHAGCTTLISACRSGPIDYAEMIRENLGQGGAAVAEASFPDFPALHRLVLIGEAQIDGAISWSEMLAQGEGVSDAEVAQRAATVDPDDPAMIIYTSGTTGLPKGAVHSHICIRSCEERGLLWGVTRMDAQLNYLPLFHLYAITVMLMCVLTGARNILMARFEPDLVLRLIERERVSHIHGFDTHWRALVEAQSRVQADLSSLRLGTCASGPLSAREVAHRAQAICHTISAFGMTECWSFCAVAFPNATLEQRCETSGYPMPGIRFRIMDQAGKVELPAGEQGEIWISSYTNMLRYYNNPAATAQVMRDGWLRTGDIGLIRPDGYLVFLGRYKDMLKVGGENVAPAEVEAHLCAMPAVVGAAVVGLPDACLGEVAAAFVVLRPDAELSLEDVNSALRGQIASYKVPRYLFCLEEFPLTPTGKVMKPELRARALTLMANANNSEETPNVG